jgi:hypothetical protein
MSLSEWQKQCLRNLDGKALVPRGFSMCWEDYVETPESGEKRLNVSCIPQKWRRVGILCAWDRRMGELGCGAGRY